MARDKRKNPQPEDFRYHNKLDRFLIDAYKMPTIKGWERCPVCNKSPFVWIFDNGASTGCGCHNSQYDHFSVHAESINSLVAHTGRTLGPTTEEKLRHNWNHWVNTREHLCVVRSMDPESEIW